MTSIWKSGSAQSYAAAKHGPDGACFLDPLIAQMLDPSFIVGRDILDGGCGAGHILPALRDAGARRVLAVDNNWEMVAQATLALGASEDHGPVKVVEGDVCNLAGIEQPSFDIYFSINVACNIVDLGQFFREGFRVLRPGGRMYVTAPDWLEYLFLRNGLVPKEVAEEIDAELLTQADPFAISAFDGVFRATIIEDRNRFRLVQPNELKGHGAEALLEGRQIWRKIPGLVVPNVWHNLPNYVYFAKEAGFSLHGNNIQGLKFDSPEQRADWNAATVPAAELGQMYERYNPFSVLTLLKP